MVSEIQADEFATAVRGAKGLVLVDFYANWCGPCKMLAPIMEEISADYPVLKVDVDRAGALAREFGIMSIPCVILFRDGEEVARRIGLQSKEQILAMLEA